MRIITISGLDGSGKSTQIEMLKTYLEVQGKKVFYFHAIEFGIAKKINNLKKYCLICRLLGKCDIKNNQEKSVTRASWLTLLLRKAFFGIDLCRFSALIKKLDKKGYDYLVSDRYFHDSVVNIEYLSGKKYTPFPIATPDVSIYLQVTPENIVSRERIPDQGLEYLQNKKELYDAKTSVWNWKVIDGNKEKNVIFKEIKKYA